MHVSAFALQQQCRVVVADAVWPAKPKQIYCLALYRKSLPTSDLQVGTASY